MTTAALMADTTNEGDADESESSPHALPRPETGAVVARFFVVLGIFLWYGLRRFWGALTETLDGPRALRMAFERLGPIYVKLGQLVASGEALFPKAYSEEFRTLLDRVPPIPWSEVQRVVREDLGKPLEEAFAEVDATPLAAASIAQVHTAKLLSPTLPAGSRWRHAHRSGSDDGAYAAREPPPLADGEKLDDGTDVVLKVQRPGIGELAAADIAIMRMIARFAEWVSDLARGSNVVAFVDDFEKNLERELDFRLEAQRMRDFMDVMREMGNRVTAAPKVVDELTHARVLTMERFRGWRIDDVPAVRASGYDVEERLLQGIRAWFQPLILRGFFHGDVHAGNFMLLEDGRVGFLDFGIVGDLGHMDRRGVIEFVSGFQQRDFERVAGAMVSMRTARGEMPVDAAALGADLHAAFAGTTPDEFDLKDFVPGMIDAARKHGLRMPRDLVLVTKQLVYLDRITRTYGGARTNVLTDERLTNLITQDVLVAMFSRG